MGLNISQLRGHMMGKSFARKGIFLVLSPKEFENVTIQKKFMTGNDVTDSINRDLVKTCNDLQWLGLYTFWRRRNGAGKDEVSDLKELYSSMVKKMEISKERIKEMEAEPIPTPLHFDNREIIFGYP